MADNSSLTARSTAASDSDSDDQHTTTPADYSALADLVTQATDRPRRPVTSPLDQQLLGQVPVCTPEDVAYAFSRARTAQKSWAATPLAQRCRVINRFRSLLLRESDPLLDLVHAENGKSRLNAFEELMDTVLTAGYYAQMAPRHLATRLKGGAIPGLTTTYERYLPKGVIGIISPWNYPLTLAISDAIPALLAGNTVVLKPDSLTPLTALAALDLLYRAGLPKGAMQIVTGSGASLGTPIINQADYLMFTGSTATGRLIGKQCAARLIGFSAELGGKNPLLVLADAKIPHTVKGAIQACFSTTGQLCVSIERIYVNEAVWDQFVPAFVKAVKAIKLGADSGWGTDLGPLISQAQFDKVSGQVQDAVAKGATVLAGGRTRPDLGPLFYEPTVLTDVPADALCARQETFGPVVSLYRVRSDQEAVALANDSDYGLNSSVWSGDLRHAQAVARQLRTGTVNINEGYAAAWASHGAAMGGTGISGVGRRHGREGILKYTEPQTIASQHGLLLGPPAGVPRSAYASFMKLGGHLLHRLPLAAVASAIRKVHGE